MPDIHPALPLVDRTSGPESITEGSAVLIDKPPGWSSFKVVKVLRRATGIRKIGHAGTLDPMATGLLICCVGRSATRRIDEFMNLVKEYTGTIRFGETTASYDAESEVEETRSTESVSEDSLEAAMSAFVGDIEQIPPMYSAVQIGGQRLYKLAREGKTIDRPPRPVHIDRFDLLAWRNPDADVRVTCSKGTYIRSLAHDLGQALGVGAHLVSLRRTRIGPYSVDDAIPADAIHLDHP